MHLCFVSLQKERKSRPEGQDSTIKILTGGKKIIDFLAVKSYTILVGRKGGNMPDKQRGRPTSNNPKSLRVDVRLTEDELKMLDKYCQQKGVSRPQGLRDGIVALHKN